MAEMTLNPNYDSDVAEVFDLSDNKNYGQVSIERKDKEHQELMEQNATGAEEKGWTIQNKRVNVIVFIGPTADLMWKSVVVGTSRNVSIITFLDKGEMSCLSIEMEHLQTSITRWKRDSRMNWIEDASIKKMHWSVVAEWKMN
jgi:hypothetical protein